jgi:tetratricopeptide (TPR) repeat protein
MPRAVNSSVPRALEAICLTAMALDPQKRYPSAAALAEDLERHLADKAVSAWREPWLVSAGRWIRNHRGVTSGAAASLLVALAALTIGLIVVGGLNNKLAAANSGLVAANLAETQAHDQTRDAHNRTRDALATMTDDVIEQLLGKQNQYRLGEHEKAFLRKVQRMYEDLSKSQGHSAQARLDRGKGSLRLAYIRWRLGELEEAEAAYRESLSIYQQLHTEFPTDPRYRYELGRTYDLLGVLIVSTKRWKEAEAAYDSALGILQSLTAEFSSIPDYSSELARAHLNLGHLWAQTGRPTPAEAAYGEAIALYRRLATEFPDDPLHREGLSRTFVNLGVLFEQTGQPHKAEKSYLDALLVQKDLAAKYPTETAFTQIIGQSQHNLGNVLFSQRRWPEAESAYREALTIRNKLAAEFPTVPEYRMQLAFSYGGLGRLLDFSRRTVEAEAVYNSATPIFKKLVADFPGVPEYKARLAGHHQNIGLLLANANQHEKAEQAFRESVALCEKLVGEFPEIPDYANQLAGTLVDFAKSKIRQVDPAAGRELLKQARPYHEAALRANPRNAAFRRFLRNNRYLMSVASGALGDHATSTREAEDLARFAEDPIEDAFDASLFVARCIPLAQKDAKLPESAREELATKYADRAVALLNQAVANGFRSVALVEKETGFNSVRDREDFQKLLKELKASAKSPPEKKNQAM